MSKAFGTNYMGILLIGGGMCGIITSQNSFIMGDSKAIYSMAKSNMLPNNFAKLNSNSTPAFGIILGEVLCTISPFFGKPRLNLKIEEVQYRV